MAGDSGAQTTTDHERIRAWAQRHGGVPATVRDTSDKRGPGVLTLDIVGYGAGEEDLEHIDWEVWFEKFEEEQLAFLHQDEKADGEESTFFKLVRRDSTDAS